jgi:hypothetical protein
MKGGETTVAQIDTTGMIADEIEVLASGYDHRASQQQISQQIAKPNEDEIEVLASGYDHRASQQQISQTVNHSN